jgi:alpha-L-rhamnosidase
VSASFESVRGRVATRWRRTDAGFELDVTVPPTATAVVHVPAEDGASVTEIGSGTATAAARAPGVVPRGRTGDRLVYEVGSGEYVFRVAR